MYTSELYERGGGGVGVGVVGLSNLEHRDCWAGHGTGTRTRSLLFFPFQFTFNTARIGRYRFEQLLETLHSLEENGRSLKWSKGKYSNSCSKASRSSRGKATSLCTPATQPVMD